VRAAHVQAAYVWQLPVAQPFQCVRRELHIMIEKQDERQGSLFVPVVKVQLPRFKSFGGTDVMQFIAVPAYNAFDTVPAFAVLVFTSHNGDVAGSGILERAAVGTDYIFKAVECAALVTNGQVVRFLGKWGRLSPPPYPC
jgi:hypothetical protein